MYGGPCVAWPGLGGMRVVVVVQRRPGVVVQRRPGSWYSGWAFGTHFGLQGEFVKKFPTD